MFRRELYDACGGFDASMRYCEDYDLWLRISLRHRFGYVDEALCLRRSHPGIRIVGGYSPPFRALGEEEEDALVRQINDARPDVLWVGIGVPKQEKWMARMRERLDVPVMAGVGAAFDFHSGRIPMAPRWMQSHGLEWVYRISREPRRLACTIWTATAPLAVLTVRTYATATG